MLNMIIVKKNKTPIICQARVKCYYTCVQYMIKHLCAAVFLAFIKEGLIKNKLEKHKWIIHYIETHLHALIWIHILPKIIY